MLRRLRLLAALFVAACAPDVDDTPVTPAPPEAAGDHRWSDPATWAPDAVPVAGSAVTIAEGRVVVLDITPPPLGRITVNGTLLVHPDSAISLLTDELVVRGTFRAGTAASPHRRPLTITLTGIDPGTEAMTDKAIAVLPGGTLELHGEPRAGWTRLAQTASAGSVQLTLESSPGWRAGDRIVVASTDFDPGEAEDVVVASAAGNTITLQTALRHDHFGVTQQVAGRTVDERAEVGLLTRNITVQGDSQSLGAYGGHIIVLPGAVARIDGVTLYRMGQAGKVARYPMHWHMAGDVTGQYIRNASIWRTANRCITIHGSDRATASGNVCYDHSGHGYFLEDGAESGNTLDRNLGLVARAPALAVRILASDATPSTFWITNPDNVVTRNAAAGSVGFGFWYALPAAPTGLSTGQPDAPRRTPLGVFRDNVAHSNRRPGLNVDDGPRPDGTTETASFQPRVGAAASGALVTAVFDGFTGYKHTGRAVWLRGREHRLRGAVLADNMIGATFASSDSWLESSIIIGETDNRTQAPSASFPVRGFEFYDGTVGAMSVTFVNFVPSGVRAASAFGYNRNNGFPISQDNFGTAIQLINANAAYLENPRPDKDGDKASLFRDLDGSITGRAATTVVTNHPFLLTSACTFRGDWNAWHCPDRFDGLQLVSEGAEAIAPLALTRDDGVSVALSGVPNNPKSAAISVLPDRGYAVEWNGVPPARPRITLQRAHEGDAVQLSFPYAGGPFRVVRDLASNQPLPLAATLAEVEAGTGDRYWHDLSTGRIHVRIVVRAGRTSSTIQVIPG